MAESLDLDHPVLAPQAQQGAVAALAQMDAQATRKYTPSGKGEMVWRCWGEGPPVLLLHGGGGAWSHWIRNIGPLAGRHAVWAPDLPGLGESALPAELSIEGIAQTLEQGLRRLLPPDAVIDLVGFSFGTPVASCLATRLPGRIRHLFLASTRFVVVPENAYPPLVDWKAVEDPLARLAAHRRNLELVMIADPARVDALAVQVQSVNVPKGRFFGPKLKPNENMHRFLPQVRASGSITGVSGAADQFAQNFLHRQEAGLKAMHPAGRFHLLPGAGHWVQYEAAEAFNAILLDTLSQDQT
jgi:pimeloyl-ACP methyl ester carboxylesterase